MRRTLYTTTVNGVGVSWELTQPGDWSYAEYQRETKTAFVARRIGTVDPTALGVAIGSVRDGKLWCVDGRQRIAAVARANDDGAGLEMMAVVYHHLGYQEEAQLFVCLNLHRLQVQRAESFHAEVEAGDPEAVRLRDLVAGLGLRLARGKGKKGVRTIGAVGALAYAYRLQGHAATARALQFLRDVWPDDAEKWHGGALWSTIFFFWRYPEADNDHLRRALHRCLPVGGEALVQGMREEEDPHARDPKAGTRWLVRQYNSQNPACRLPELLEKPYPGDDEAMAAD